MSLSPEGHAFTRANKKPRPQDATALPKAEVQAQPERLNCLLAYRHYFSGLLAAAT